MFGEAWLVDDILRIEQLLIKTAGSSGHPLIDEAATHLIRAGGKRLRPALVLLSSRAGESGKESTDLAAAAVELVHLATLYHDDVIDETDTRRGVPTVHSKWGTDVAVLAGDYLFAKGCGLGAEAGGEVPGILSRAIGDVCTGQIIETEAVGDAKRPASDYLETIRLKTAALFEASCELGAATSEAKLEDRESLKGYGSELGIAFQIVDDLIDLVGDPDVTGKQPGTDLKEGVFTAPVLIAAERDPRLAEALSEGRRDLETVLPVLRETGALDDAIEQTRSHAGAARDHLKDLPEGDYRSALTDIVDGVLAQV
jgi:heptaprenyl diphosphate synthase